MNILVTGANGQLGTCIRLAKKNAEDKYFYTDIDDLNITDKDAIKSYVDDNEIDLIINCAAYTNVDKAEEPDQLEIVEKINAIAPGYMAEVGKDRNLYLIHISTDYVFGGNLNNTPCKENQTPNPTGVYGMTKLQAEKEIESSGANYIILRTAWLYSEYGRNFVKTMLNLFDTKDELNVVFDQCGTPTYAGDLAEAIIDIVNERKYIGNSGIYHFSNEGVCSWYDFAKMIQSLSEKSGCRIQPCLSNEFPSKVIRPAYSVLDKNKYKHTFKKTVPYWTDSLRKCVDNLMIISKNI